MRITIAVIAWMAGCGFRIDATPGGGVAADAATDATGATDATDPGPRRVTANLVALYTFEEGTGTTVFDRSGYGSALDLAIADAANVTWGTGTLTITADTLIASPGPATNVLDPCRNADAVTLEAWISPAMIGGYYPRVATLSVTNTDLALALLAIDTHFEFRMRGPMTDSDGLPSLNSPAGAVTLAPIHVALVSQPGGTRRLYVDGTQVATDALGGDLSSWGTTAHRLALGNEIDGGRPWHGTFDLVAIYAAALTPEQVATNFAAGPK